MKKIITIAAIAMALAGCSGTDKKACRDSVVTDVGTENVMSISPYRFIAKDVKGNVWYYETMNLLDAEVTHKQPVFFGG